MAKAAKTAKTPKQGTTGKDGGHKANAADLKYIGAAFDRAIESLEEIKTHATNPGAVTAKIGNLQKLKASLRLECPQNWFVVFDI